MGKNDCVQLFLERKNLLGQRLEPRWRHRRADLQIVQSRRGVVGNIIHATNLLLRTTSVKPGGMATLRLKLGDADVASLPFN
jgi:hypothetical protein